MSQRFEDRCIVVTGGASGIGEACARRFASEGARIVVADIAIDAANRLAKELGGGAVEVDVSSAESIEAVAESIALSGRRSRHLGGNPAGRDSAARA